MPGGVGLVPPPPIAGGMMTGGPPIGPGDPSQGIPPGTVYQDSYVSFLNQPIAGTATILYLFFFSMYFVMFDACKFYYYDFVVVVCDANFFCFFFVVDQIVS